MGKLHRVIVGLTLLVLGALTQEAQGQKTYALGVAGGAAIPAGKFSDAEASGANGTIALAIGVADVPVGVRIDGVYNHFSHRTDTPSPAVPNDARVIGGILNLLYSFPGSTVKSYLIAGVGYYNTRASTSGAKSDNNVGFNGGVGVTFGVGPFATFVETRYHSISRSAAQGGVLQFVPVTFGLLF